MIFQQKFFFKIEGRLRNKARFEDVQVFDYVDIDIPEASSRDLPVACWWSPPAKDYHIFGPHPAQVAVRVAEDGSLYQPVEHKWDTVTPSSPSSSAFVRREEKLKFETVGVEAFSEVLRTGVLFFMANVLCPQAGTVDFVRTREDNRDLRAAEIAAQFGKYLLVDGVLHRRIGIPVVERPSYSVGSAKTDYLDLADTSGDAVYQYPLTEFERMVADMKAATKRWDPKEDTVNESIRPEVLIPSALEYDVVDATIRGAAVSVVHSLSSDYGRESPKFHDYSRAKLLAYADIRDALHAGASSENLKPLLREMVRIEAEGSSNGVPGYLGERCAIALQRSENVAASDEDAEFMSARF